jgi:1-acyl-sn-glycerol-3-phosphate acyltransferase
MLDIVNCKCFCASHVPNTRTPEHPNTRTPEHPNTRTVPGPDRQSEADRVSPRAGPPVSWRSRLRFGVGAVVLTFVTAVIAPLQIVAHFFEPSARTFKRWAARWGRWTLRGFGVRTRLTDRTQGRVAQPCVFVANHQNMLDIFALAAEVPYPFGFIAKAELQRYPFLGIALRHSASILIDRTTPRRSVRSLQEAARRIREGHSVLVYPEGSRSYAPEMGAFRKGAFRLAVEAGVPVVPVVARDGWCLADERRRVARSGSMEIVMGAPLATEDLARSDLPALMQRTRRRMEDMLERDEPAPVADPAARSSS